MIKLVTGERALKSYKTEGDIYYVRIMSLAAVYGFSYDFLRFYVQETAGKVTAAISVLDCDVTVSFDKHTADLGELGYFLRMAGFKSLLCSAALELPFAFEEGAVMQNGARPCIALKQVAVSENVPLKQLYDFLNTGAAFEHWYADISHRIRHGGAGAYAVVQGGRPVSAALLSAIYGSAAILSAVKTDKTYRGQGYSSALIGFITESFGGVVYLMRQKGKNRQFYEKLGFKDIGIWRMYR